MGPRANRRESYSLLSEYIAEISCYSRDVGMFHLERSFQKSAYVVLLYADVLSGFSGVL